MFFLTFISLFSLILYLLTFTTNNKRHTVNNGDRKEKSFNFFKKKLKCIQFCNFQRALRKISVFENYSLGICGWRFS